MDEARGTSSGPEHDKAGQAVEDVAADAAVLMDVRSEEEWLTGHAKGALHWELARLEAGELPDIPKDGRVYVYCAAGGRAGVAKEILIQNEWNDVVNIGGLEDWENAGGEVE